MNLSLIFILCCILVSGCQSFNNKNSHSTKSVQTTPYSKQRLNSNSDEKWLSKASIYEELTGQKLNSIQAGMKILKLAEQSQSEKNYILALKRYNTVIVRFPQSDLARSALFGKARLYKKMGLMQQADYNTQLATQFKVAAKSLVTKKTVDAKKTSVDRKTASHQKTGTQK